MVRPMFCAAVPRLLGPGYPRGILDYSTSGCLRALPGEDKYRRPVALKGAYDPRTVFALNANIRLSVRTLPPPGRQGRPALLPILCPSRTPARRRPPAPRHGDRRRQRGLLAAEPGDAAAGAVGRQARLLRGDPGPA
jgi:hypothetical protein